jgi:hypothetical protein
MNRIILAALFSLCGALPVPAQNLSPEDLARRAIERRAVEAVIWGMPAVNYHLMYQEMVRKTKGGFNQVLYWPRLLDWKNQTLTPNPDVIYLMPFFNTKDVGPVVLEIPPADEGLINGSVMNYWQAAIEDVGPGGVDKGKGGKPLEGKASYRLNVPANAPVSQYWSMTVYDRDTHAFIREAKWVGRSSQTPGLQRNADGSTDIFFGPSAPAGKESNFVPTDPGGRFEVLARFYGPQKPLFDKTWKLPDIERMAVP